MVGIAAEVFFLYNTKKTYIVSWFTSSSKSFVMPSELVGQLRKFLQQPGNSLYSSLNTQNAKAVKSSLPLQFQTHPHNQNW